MAKTIPESQIMETIYLQIAGFNFQITLKKFEYPFLIEKIFRDRMIVSNLGFILNSKPAKVDFEIEVSQALSYESIVKTKLKKHFLNFYNETGKNKVETFYHLSDNQFQIVLRDAYQSLLTRGNGMFIHGSASKIKGSAYVFLGPSGAGKSTIMTLLARQFRSLADDSIIIRLEKGKPYFYQTPFIEKNWWLQKNKGRQNLGKVFFLDKGKETKMTPITNKSKIIEEFTRQLITNQEDTKLQLPNILKLIETHHQFYYLSYSLDKAQEMIKLISAL